MCSEYYNNVCEPYVLIPVHINGCLRMFIENMITSDICMWVRCIKQEYNISKSFVFCSVFEIRKFEVSCKILLQTLSNIIYSQM